MNILLWIAQILLAGVFTMSGVMKVFMYDAFVTKAPAMAQVSHGLVTFIGATELLGALGLILPMLLRIKPWLTPLAAVGLSAIMLMAIPVHLLRNESIAVNALLFALGAFVAYGRWRGTPVGGTVRRRVEAVR